MADEKGKGKSPEEEISQYLDILAMDPTSRVFARLAEAYRKAGRIDEAVSVCRDGLQNHPGYTAGQVVLARALYDGGKSAEARGEIAQVVASAPDNLTAQKLLAQIEVRLNDHGAAAKAYRMVQLLDPSDEEAQKYLVEAGGVDPEKPPAYASPPIETAAPPVPAAAAEAAAPAGEAGVPAGLTFEDEPAAPVSTEPVFDLGEMEAAAAGEEAPVDDSPFEVFTKEPRYGTPPAAMVEEKSEPFAEIELSEEDDLDVEPVMEEPPVMVEEETPAVMAEEMTELVIDDVEPVMEAPPAVAEETPAVEPEEMAELVIDDVEPVMEEPPVVAEEAPIVEAEGMAEEAAEEMTELVIDDVEPAIEEPPVVMEEPPVVTAEVPVVQAEEMVEGVTELVVDSVEPVMEEPPVVTAEVPVVQAEEIVAVEAEPPAESGDDFDIFGDEEEKEKEDIPGRETSAAGVFNTETLANLYITQGFYGKAADVYRQMLGDCPDDANLRQKLEEVLALEKMPPPSVEETPVDFGREARVGTQSPVIGELQRLLTKLKERPR